MRTHTKKHEFEFQIIPSDLEFHYQQELTSKLDSRTSLFDQEIINEIVLWKVNRYTSVDSNTLKLINEIDTEATELDVDKTSNVLSALIQNKGIKLPMASAILRFRNKNIYQIIDQRVYRIVYKGQKLKIKRHLNGRNIMDQVDLYIQYLKDLREISKQFNIPFDKSDRILFMVDRRINSDYKLDNY